MKYNIIKPLLRLLLVVCIVVIPYFLGLLYDIKERDNISNIIICWMLGLLTIAGIIVILYILMNLCIWIIYGDE